MATKQEQVRLEGEGEGEAPPTGEPPAGITVPVTPDPETPPAPTQPQNNGRTFTVEDIERARQQEKDKLYPEIEELRNGMKTLTADLERRQQEQAAAEQAAREAAEARDREEKSAKQLLEEAEARFNAELQAVRGEVATRDALLAREAAFQELQRTREAMLDSPVEGDPSGRTVRDSIAPQLLKFVGGSTPDEIAQSIATVMQTSADIVAEVAGATQRQRQQQKGASVTQPPVGPMETQTANETLTASDIRAMPMDEYAKRRSSLLNAASRAARGAQ